MRLTYPLLIAASLIACTPAIPPQNESTLPPPPSDSVAPIAELPKDETRVLDADTAITTASGAHFEAPKGWTFTRRADGVLVLTAPEQDLTLSFVELEGEDAVIRAWKKADPNFAREVEARQPLPARDGWDAVAQTVFTTDPKEGKVVVTVDLQKGKTHYLILVEGLTAGLERRGAQLQTVVNTFEAQGVAKESFAGKTPNPLDEARLKAFADFVEQARQQADVPGVAMAIVDHDKVVMSQGFGVREVGKAAKVTPKTLFAIGSTTKSLTTLMTARIVEQKKLDWSTHITELLPGFTLGDADLTQRLTLEDTFCACTGMPRQDMEMLFHYRGRTVQKTLDQMRTMKPTTAFGETFQYSNAMVLVGGVAAARRVVPSASLDTAYAKALSTWVLDPLGMRSTTVDFAAVARVDHASPHGQTMEGKVQPVALSADDFTKYVAPSGGAWSNLDDMVRYVQLELGRGVLDGKAIIDEVNLMRRRKPHVKITDTSSYGLGLFIDQNAGIEVVHHGGNTLGFTSDMFLLPEQKIGVVLLANVGGANGFRSAVRRRLLEIIFDGKSEATENLAASLKLRREARERSIKQTNPTPDAAWVQSLVGQWTEPALGLLTVRTGPKGARIDTGDWVSRFTEKTSTTGDKSLVLTDPPWVGFSLLVQEKDGTPTLLLDAGQQKYIFVRAKP